MPIQYPPLNFSSGAYGARPTATSAPRSIYSEALSADPALKGQRSAADSVVGNQLAGQLSPETTNALKDRAAEFGVSSGMPGSGLASNLGLRNLGLTMESLQNQGLQNYLGSLKTIGSMQLDPALLSSLQTYNNQVSAAPDPAAAAQQEYSLYQHEKNPAKGSYYGPIGQVQAAPYYESGIS